MKVNLIIFISIHIICIELIFVFCLMKILLLLKKFDY